MNSIVISGKVMEPPVCRITPAGVPVAKIKLRSPHQAVNSDGYLGEDEFNVIAFRQLAEESGELLTNARGGKIIVKGHLAAREYETRSGYHGTAIEIIAEHIEYLFPRIRIAGTPPAGEITPPDDLPPGWQEKGERGA